MAQTDSGVWFPDGPGALRGQPDLEQMARSINNLRVVSSAALRDELTSKASKTNPIWVYRTDTDSIEVCNGTIWRRFSGPVDIQIGKYSEVLKQFLPASTFYAADSVTITTDVTRTVDVDFSGSYCTVNAGAAAAGYFVARAAGTAHPFRYRIHTGTGSSAAIWRTFFCHWRMDVPKGSTLIDAGFSSVEGAGFQTQYTNIVVQG